MLFHRIRSNEVHPTFGETVVVANPSLSFPAALLLPISTTYDVDELSLEFQTAKLLSNMTWRVVDNTTRTIHLQDNMTTLKGLAKDELRDLAQAEALYGCTHDPRTGAHS